MRYKKKKALEWDEYASTSVRWEFNFVPYIFGLAMSAIIAAHVLF